jgi:hypothetical protein
VRFSQRIADGDSISGIAAVLTARSDARRCCCCNDFFLPLLLQWELFSSSANQQFSQNEQTEMLVAIGSMQGMWLLRYIKTE